MRNFIIPVIVVAVFVVNANAHAGTDDQRDCEIASIEDIPIYTIVGPTVPVDIGALALDNQHLLFAEALNSEYGSAFESWVEYRLSRINKEESKGLVTYSASFDSSGQHHGPIVNFKVVESKPEVIGIGIFIY